ncbi:MAG: hypothetical protein K9L30_10535 [Desulfobacterales bacterium]|nr:hypothetical protein [Desulfobacterales bacterium]
MKKIKIFMMLMAALLLVSCSHSNFSTEKSEEDIQTILKETAILQSWQGDYPVSQIVLLPETQRENAVGYIGRAETFKSVWKAFMPGTEVPEIDFKTGIVIFVRNTRFYNRISIGKVAVTKGIAEVLAMETMSAMPIEDNVAMSMVLVNRDSIKGIISADKVIPVVN